MASGRFPGLGPFPYNSIFNDVCSSVPRNGWIKVPWRVDKDKIRITGRRGPVARVPHGYKQGWKSVGLKRDPVRIRTGNLGTPARIRLKLPLSDRISDSRSYGPEIHRIVFGQAQK